MLWSRRTLSCQRRIRAWQRSVVGTIALILVLVVLVSAVYASWGSAPWVPTRRVDIERLLDVLDLQPGERFVELGCGDGRVCRAVKRRFPEAEVVGVELSLLPWLVAKLFSPGVDVRFGDVFKLDVSEFDVVYVFLVPQAHDRLGEIWMNEAGLLGGDSRLSTGSSTNAVDTDNVVTELVEVWQRSVRVVSYVWPIGLFAHEEHVQEGQPGLFEHVLK